MLRNANGRHVDIIRKDIIKTFKEIGFQIEITTNLHSVDFLDITFDLNTRTYRPYKKPNDTLLYVNTSSNHPTQILKQLPISISQRLSKNSSSREIFEESMPKYVEALKKSGYKQPTLTFNKQNTNQRNRSRNIIWFNPPYNNNVSTNIAASFLKLIDKHFPPTHKLHKLFNRNNVKVSYSCTPNIGRIIKGHNKKLSSPPQKLTNDCNCRNKDNCPLQGNCRVKSVVYKCDVEAPNVPKRTYIGLTEREFKERYNGHKQSLNNTKYKNSTTLSMHVWELKKNMITPNLKWSIVKQMKPYNNITKTCHLCLYEKLVIMTYPVQNELLNKRSELIAKCRHENKFLLANYKSND